MGFVLAGYDVIKTSVSDMSQREKYINNGAAIGEYVGGLILGCAVGFATSETGPVSIGFAVIGGAYGASIGRQIGGIIGGFVYDIHKFKEFENDINEYGKYQSANCY